MPAKVILGAQWGDEGKGKIIDLHQPQSPSLSLALYLTGECK